MSEQGYNTKQKDRILQCLKAHCTRAHSMDELLAFMEQDGLSVGKTTAYRHIQRLVDSGRVRKFVEPDGKCATFQYLDEVGDCSAHLHLKCVRCGRFIHLDCSLMDGIQEHLLVHHGFWIDREKSLLFGLCEDCLKKEGTPHGTD
ncbi:MAG: transcriptional repressor [Clostridia bacterium]|nr:transcriptional repressor [Clostridia bacterium]MBR3552802.1 transcriptional repressor [Clostridia bacterium]